MMQWDSSIWKSPGFFLESSWFEKKFPDLNPILIHICVICLNSEYNIEYMHCLKFEQTNAQK